MQDFHVVLLRHLNRALTLWRRLFASRLRGRVISLAAHRAHLVVGNAHVALGDHALAARDLAIAWCAHLLSGVPHACSQVDGGELALS